MKRIDTPTRAVDLFGAGKDGFTDGDPVAAVLATRLNAAWFNGMQEEVLEVIEQAGLTPDGADLTQLWQALQTLLAARAPVGEVILFGAQTPPSGFLACNGAQVSRTAYADLFGVVGTTFGAGDGTTTFALPDLRGEFLRGWDAGRGIDSGRAFGSWQADEFKQHTHKWEGSNLSSGSGYPTLDGSRDQNLSYSTDRASAAPGGTETRPRNIAVLACIRY